MLESRFAFDGGGATYLHDARLFTDSSRTTPGFVGSYIDQSVVDTQLVSDWRDSQSVAGTRVDAELNFLSDGWGQRAAVGLTGGDDSNWESFSVQWDGYLEIAVAGQRLATASDDGSRMWIDTDHDGRFEIDELLVNGWGRGQGPTTGDRTTSLAAGLYAVRIQYCEIGGGNLFSLVSSPYVPRQFIPTETNPVQVVRVLAIDFDPRVPSEGNLRMHEVFGWSDPSRMASQFERDLEWATGGAIDIQLIDWRELDAFPVFTDGFRYTADEYVANRRADANWHPGTTDLYELLKSQAVAPLVNSGSIDEIWLFGDHYFSLLGEAWMAGPNSFFINGPTFGDLGFNRAIAGYGFSYERSVAEMIHNLGHRIENHGQRAFGNWNLAHPVTAFDRFTGNYLETTSGPYGVGSTHVPANADGHYDYGDARVVQSTAFDFVNYPAETGATTPVTRETWAFGPYPDYQRDYLNWYLAMMPRSDGAAADGRAANWFKYIWDFNSYESGSGLPRREDAFAAAATIDKTGGATHEVTVRYYDDAGIDTASLDLADVRVTGPMGQTLTPTSMIVGSAVRTTSGEARTATYRIPATGGVWDLSDNGRYQIVLQSNQVRDRAGRSVPGGWIGDFLVAAVDPAGDATAPTATLGTVAVAVQGASSQFVSVHYSDASSIRVSSLSNDDIRVIGPTGAPIPVIFYDVDDYSDGTSRTATYWLIPPGGDWDYLDNGEYIVQLLADGVRDIFGNGVATNQTLGSFRVEMTAPQTRFPNDLAEASSGDWIARADDATATAAYDTSRRVVGGTSLRFDTTGGFDTSLRYPSLGQQDWNLAGARSLNFQIYASNPSPFGFQEGPWLRLNGRNGGYFEYRYYEGENPAAPIDDARDTWLAFQVPLSPSDGSSHWRRTQSGAPSLAHIGSIEFHADTWDAGFTYWIDAIHVSSSEWHNAIRPMDVDDDQFVVAIDALAIVNELNARLWTDNAGRFLSPPQPPVRFFDVDNDGFATAIDVLLIVNFLNSLAVGGEGENAVRYAELAADFSVSPDENHFSSSILSDAKRRTLGGATMYFAESSSPTYVTTRTLESPQLLSREAAKTTASRRQALTVDQKFLRRSHAPSRTLGAPLAVKSSAIDPT